MRDKFRQWYAAQVEEQLEEEVEEPMQADLRPMFVIKPIGAKWLISLYNYLLSNPLIISNGFKAVNEICHC